jgi:hypothetical protein
MCLWTELRLACERSAKRHNESVNWWKSRMAGVLDGSRNELQNERCIFRGRSH